jgi:hypothetical protein
LNLRPVQIKFEKRLGSATTLYGTVALSFVIPSEAEGSAVPRTFPGNAEHDAQEHCHLACSAPNDLGSGAGVLAQNIGVFCKETCHFPPAEFIAGDENSL